MTAKHTSYANGAIRNASGVLVAFYDAEEKQLSINGFVQTFYAPTLLDAMEIVGSRCA